MLLCKAEELGASLQHPQKKPGKAESAQNRSMALQTQEFGELTSRRRQRSWSTEFLVFLVTLGDKTVKEKDIQRRCSALAPAVHRQAYFRPLTTHLPQPQADYPERLEGLEEREQGWCFLEHCHLVL